MILNWPLFIEDLVLLHGIDYELAQIFTEGRGAEGFSKWDASSYRCH